MALGASDTVKGEVYRITVTRLQEQEIEVEVEEDGEDLHDSVWDWVDFGSWETVSQNVEVIEPITCGGEV